MASHTGALLTASERERMQRKKNRRDLFRREFLDTHGSLHYVAYIDHEEDRSGVDFGFEISDGRDMIEVCGNWSASQAEFDKALRRVDVLIRGLVEFQAKLKSVDVKGLEAAEKRQTEEAKAERQASEEAQADEIAKKVIAKIKQNRPTKNAGTNARGQIRTKRSTGAR